MTLRVAVHGAGGRMGRAVLGALADDSRTIIAAAIHGGDPALLGTDAGRLFGPLAIGVPVTSDLGAAVAHCDVVIDFTSPQGTAIAATACMAAARPLVVGTTGLGPDEGALLARLADAAPVLVAPNMSVGVTVLLHLAARAAELLGPEFDAEILEMHHRHKVDAPSGTGLRLQEVVAAAKGLDPRASRRTGRDGHVGPRPRDEVGLFALRGGDVVGDHTLVFAGPGERIELTHRAHSRSIFAGGAVHAACWLAQRSPGLYSMPEVLGLSA